MAIQIGGTTVIDNNRQFLPITISAGSTTGSNGQVLTSTGVGITWTASTATTGTLNYQEFTSSGTWTKPSGASIVYVEAWGAGGGGGSGRRGATSTDRAGGGGGAGAPNIFRYFNASELSATVSVTVGAAGTGGAGITSDSTNGNAGGDGGNSTFGSYLTAYGGNGGSGGGLGLTYGAGGSGWLSRPGSGSFVGGDPNDSNSNGTVWVFGGSYAGGNPTTFGGAGGGNSSVQNYGLATNGGSSSKGGPGGSGGIAAHSTNVSVGNNYLGGTSFVGAAGTGGKTGHIAGDLGTNVEYGGGLWVINGFRVGIHTSSDSTTWTLNQYSDILSSAIPKYSINTYSIKLLKYLNSQWVLGFGRSNVNYIYTSSNAASNNWTLKYSESISGSLNKSLMAYGAGVYVWISATSSFGSLSTIRTSTDLINWTTRATLSSDIYSLIYDGTRFVAVGGATDALSVTSTDGTSWSTVTVTGGGVFYSVATNGSSTFFASSSTGSNYGYKSTDSGATWTQVSTNLGYPGQSGVIHDGTDFVYVNGSNIFTSSDANTWTQQTDGSTDTFGGIAYASGSPNTYFVSSYAQNSNAGLASTNKTTWTNRTYTAITIAGEAGTNANGVGAGGGGGGASLNGYNSGAGGNGTNGLVRVYSW